MNTLNVPETDLPRVIIVGAGFGGLKLIRSLIKAERFQIILVDKHNYHTFQPLLYQVSSAGLSSGAISYPLRKTVRKKTDKAFFRMGEALDVDTDRQILHLNIGAISYDYLIIATGSKPNFFGNKEIEKNAMKMKSVDQAVDIRTMVIQNLEQATLTKDPEKRAALLNFVIAGGGPTGVELSGALAEFKKNVVPKDYIDVYSKEINIHLIEGQDKLLGAMSEKSSRDAKKALEKLGVELHLGELVESYDGKTVRTKAGKTFLTDAFIWTAGVTGNPLPGIDKGLIPRANRYKVNAFNQVEGFDNIFAIGDVACMQSDENPRGHAMLAQPALQQGELLAKNLISILDKKALKPFKYFDKGTMATIGRNKAVVDMKIGHLNGYLAWVTWGVVHLFYLIGFRNRIGTFLSWIYRYVNRDRASRVIIYPYKSKIENKAELSEKKKPIEA